MVARVVARSSSASQTTGLYNESSNDSQCEPVKTLQRQQHSRRLCGCELAWLPRDHLRGMCSTNEATKPKTNAMAWVLTLLESSAQARLVWLQNAAQERSMWWLHPVSGIFSPRALDGVFTTSKWCSNNNNNCRRQPAAENPKKSFLRSPCMPTVLFMRQAVSPPRFPGRSRALHCVCVCLGGGASPP